MIDPHATSSHIANAAVFGLPLASWAANLQPVFTAVLTMLSIGWYLRLYYKDWRTPKK